MNREDVFDDREIDKMRDFVSEYEYVMDEIETIKQHLIHSCLDKSMKDTLEYLGETVEVNEGSRYRDYKEQINEYDNFDPNDYNTNDGLKEDYERMKLRG